ncbi:MAG: hypothetical protein GY884_28370 [Proteobacteria bacterium]|nr:hypothetical protein [Pseudomonadota bacterium]
MTFLILLATLVSPSFAQDDEEALFSEEERIEAFQPFTDAVTQGDTNTALEALVVIVDDPEQEVFHGMAYSSMGGLFQSKELPYAALAAWAKGLQLDPDNTASGVKPALAVAEQVHDTAYLEAVFAENVGLDVDDETRGRLAYLAARGSYSKGNIATTLGILSLVGKDNPDFGKAMSLKGIALAQQGKYTDAMAALLVAQATVQDDPEMLDIVNLNLARTYFAAENFPKSIEFYAKVSRDSHWWPHAQFERAWAHFRIDDMNGALGLLHNHVSPFYDEWYFPEAELLRTYSLFLICKFPEASAQIEDFQDTWTPVRDELEDTLQPMSNQDVFEDARAYVRDEDHKLPELVYRDLHKDERFLTTIDAVEQAQKELDRLQGEKAGWSQIAFNLVRERRKELVLGEGERLRSGVVSRADELTQMLNDTEIAKLDMLKLETRLYEQASVSGEMADIEKKAMRRERVRKGYVAWPYEGEYWIDEVGYYKVNAKPECPEGLMTGSGR